MASNKIQIKRTSVSGRAANTTTLINPGELALNMTDGILYSTNGSVVFEIGANNTNVNVTGTATLKTVSANGTIGTAGQVLSSDGTNIYWDDVVATDTTHLGGLSDTAYALIDGSRDFTNAIYINAASGYASIEVGGPSGGYIDLKSPFSDDYDLRIITSGTGGTITSTDALTIDATTTVFTVGGANAARILPGGNFLIGTTSDQGARLQVVGGGGLYLSDGVNAALSMYNDGADGITIEAYNQGNTVKKNIYLAQYGGSVYINSNPALHSGNFNTYAPSLTGTGAIGTWGINISGSAASLNGQPASYYTDIPSRLGFTPVQQGGAAGMGTNKLYIGWDSVGAGLRLHVDSTDYANTWPIHILGSANNAAYLGGVAAASYALLASPTFTGTVIAPTPGFSDDSTKVATTNWVNKTLYPIRGNHIINGGGTISYDGTYVKWTSRFIVISGSKGTSTPAGADYYDIFLPTSGTVDVVGTTAVTVSATLGIPLDSWRTLWYDLAAGTGAGASAFHIIDYSGSTANFQVPPTWILIAASNVDTSPRVKFCNGLTLLAGHSFDATIFDAQYVPSSNFATVAVTANTANNASYLGGVAAASYLLSSTAASTYAPINNPTFTGTVTIPSVNPTLFQAQGGSEGGELHLQKAPSGSSLSGDIAVDTIGNILRIFETAGSNRGAYLDLTQQVSQSRIVTENAGTAVLATTANNVTGGSVSATTGTFTGQVAAGGELQSNNVNGARFVQSGRGIMLRNDGSSFYILTTAASDPYGTFNGLRPFYIDIGSGAVHMDNGVYVPQLYAYSNGTNGYAHLATGDGTNSGVLEFYTPNQVKAGFIGWTTNGNGPILRSDTGVGLFSGAWKFDNTVTFCNNIYHNSAEGKNRFYFDTNGATYTKSGNGWFYWRDLSDNNIFYISASGDGIASGTMQAPIFYDTNNTGYYVDPNGTSNMNVVNGAKFTSGYDSGDVSSFQCSNWFRSSGNTGWYNGTWGGGMHMQDADWVRAYAGKSIHSDNIIQGEGSVRAPIFYDTNDTNYYLDPNNTSRLYYTRAFLHVSPGLANEGGGTSLANWNTNFTATIPKSWSFGADISQNGPSGTWWFNVNMRHENASNYWGTQQAWGWEDNACELYVRNVSGGSWGSWVRFMNSNNYASYSHFTGPVYGTVYYDQDNGAYYCDPNGTSVLHKIQHDTGLWNTSSDGFDRFYFSSGDVTYIKGGTTSTWSTAFRTNDDITRWVMSGGDSGFYSAGNVTAYWSDRRLKKNIEKITDWKTIINGLNGYRFEWNDIGQKVISHDPGVEVGLIAQEVQAVLPQAAAVQLMQYKELKDGKYIPKDDIDYDEDNPYLTVREEKLIPVLVEAVKGLMEEIETLKAQVAALKG